MASQPVAPPCGARRAVYPYLISDSSTLPLAFLLCRARNYRPTNESSRPPPANNGRVPKQRRRPALEAAMLRRRAYICFPSPASPLARRVGRDLSNLALSRLCLFFARPQHRRIIGSPGRQPLACGDIVMLAHRVTRPTHRPTFCRHASRCGPTGAAVHNAIMAAET